MSAIVLVHSPVVGPSTWRWVAEALAEGGHAACVPAASHPASWQDFVDCVADQVAHGGILVGHSGAGPLLPRIQARVHADKLVFVDAGVPPGTGFAELMPPDILADLGAMTVDGMLPPWSQWFGPDVMADLVPDAERRAIIDADLPILPLAYLGDRVPMPAGWTSIPCGYLQLSEPYAADAAEAARRGWPVLRSPGAHLDIVTRPAEIADAILALADTLGR